MSSSATRDDDQRIRELLSGMALGELENDEELQAARMLEQPRWQRELLELEIAASAINLVRRPSDHASDRLPKHLRTQIQNSAADLLQNRTNRKLALASVNALPANNALPEDTPAVSTTISEASTSVEKAGTDGAAVVYAPHSPARAFNRREAIAWIACAASMLLALGVWGSGLRVSPESALRRLLNRDPEALQIAWQPGNYQLPAEVNGQLIWSQKFQEGYMTFRGLPASKPNEQYQLWIVDPDRDDVPIDGGVFDGVDSSGVVTVKIDAKLAVLNPQAFAITIEKRGGVVVSDQSRLPLLAPVKGEAP